jgi:hypothetical protein
VNWQPLSVREGRKFADRPHEGVPSHLRGPMKYWLERAFLSDPRGRIPRLAVQVATAARVPYFPLSGATAEVKVQAAVQAIDEQGDEAILDAIDACLQLRDWQPEDLEVLSESLRVGGSLWEVGAGGLVRRVDRAATAAYEEATAVADTASTELVEAWSNAYGRSPDASDAWDHAIKAVEAVLIPIVVPTQAGAHMGHILGELDHHGDRFQMGLTSKQGITPLQTIVGMLRLLYPNPDRHIGPDHRVPGLDEAKAVVHLAVTLVQWARDKVLTRN